MAWILSSGTLLISLLFLLCLIKQEKLKSSFALAGDLLIHQTQK
jgi:hypothetical protein